MNVVIEQASEMNVDFGDWTIISTVPARSMPHFDGGQYATWIQVVTGCKLFLIQKQDAALAVRELAMEMPEDHE